MEFGIKEANGKQKYTEELFDFTKNTIENFQASSFTYNLIESKKMLLTLPLKT